MHVFVCAGFFAATVSACSQKPNPGLPDNKAIVLRSETELWSKGDLAVADQLYSPGFLCHFVAGSEWKGIQDLKRQIATTRAAFPDWNERVDDILVEGDRVAIRFTSTGTQQGEFEGMAPTGRKVSIREAAFFRVANGKIVEQWGFADSQALMQQLMSPTQLQGK